MKMIPIKEGYPDNGRDVLTRGKYGWSVACFERGIEDDPCWWAVGQPAMFKESVTHWCELPEVEPC